MVKQGHRRFVALGLLGSLLMGFALSGCIHRLQTPAERCAGVPEEHRALCEVIVSEQRVQARPQHRMFFCQDVGSGMGMCY